MSCLSTIISQRLKTYSETGCRWKGQSRGEFSICWTAGGCLPGGAGGSLQLPLPQDPLAAPQWAPPPRGGCLGPLPGAEETGAGVEEEERGAPWLWVSPPPGLGVFWMALEGSSGLYFVDLIIVKYK